MAEDRQGRYPMTPALRNAAARTGTVETCIVDRQSREHVLGCHLPGEVIVLNAIGGEQCRCNAISQDTVMLSWFSFPKIAVFAIRLYGVSRIHVRFSR